MCCAFYPARFKTRNPAFNTHQCPVFSRRLGPNSTTATRLFSLVASKHGTIASSVCVWPEVWPRLTSWHVYAGAQTRPKTPIRLIADPPAFQRKTDISKSRPMARAVAETQRHLNRQGSLDFCRSCTLRDVHGESSGLWCFCFEGTQAGSFEIPTLVQGVQGPVDKKKKKKNPDDLTPSIPPPAAVRDVRFRSQRPSDLTGTVLRVCGCPHPNTRQTVSLPLASYLIYFTVSLWRESAKMKSL